MNNESDNYVYFDNLQIIHDRGAMLEETHYYPFGLTMAGISSKAAGALTNRYKFNGGNELQSGEFSDGSGLEMYDAINRMYDPQLGRFFQPDELAESNWEMSPYNFASDNPGNFNDPFGLADADPKDDPTGNLKKEKVLEEVVVKSVKTLSHNQMQSLYWKLRDAGEGFGSVKSDALRERLERWDGVQRHMDKVHAMTRQSDEVVLDIASWFIPVGAITKVRYLKYAERLFNFKRGRIFWSGGSEVAGKTAESYAKLFGGHTLEMTLKGKYLEILTKIKGYDAVKPLWEKASREFAAAAKGEVHVFINSARFKTASVWNKIEKPVLEFKNTIIEHKW